MKHKLHVKGKVYFHAFNFMHDLNSSRAPPSGGAGGGGGDCLHSE